MSTRTRTWSKVIPVDHTQIKNGPTTIRNVREDVENRVDDILAGFVDTGTTNGLLLGRLLTVGTATSANPGTGTAAAVDIIGLTTGTMTEVVIRNSSGQSCLVSYRGNLRVGQLANDEYLVGVGTTSGTVNVLKIDTVGSTYFSNPVKFASHPLAPNTSPTTSLQYTPKDYVDGAIDADIAAIAAVTKATLGIDSGTATIGANTSASVNYNFAFNPAPVVIVTYTGDLTQDEHGTISVTPSTSNFLLYNNRSVQRSFNWVAIGTPA